MEVGHRSADPTLHAMIDPTIEAARDILDEALDAMRASIAGATPDELNRRLGDDDTNSIAVLATHSMHSTRWWLHVVMGVEPPARDRPSEFLATATSTDELLSFFDEMAADCRAALDTDAPFDGGALRERDADETVTAAWALLHALEHLREHVGHMQLTRQLQAFDKA